MEDNDLRNTVRDWFAILAFLLMLLLMGGCKSSKVVSERDVRDSVIYTYKTHYRDSLRVKDSTVFVYVTIQRDSVVLKVDKETGEVLSKDTWHWKDTNRDRDHVSDVRSKAERSDSVASVAVKSDKRTVVPKGVAKTPETKKTHCWKAYWLGMLTGVLVMLLWKYRKILVELLKKVVRLL